MNISRRFRVNPSLILTCLLMTAWSVGFIFRGSFIAIDSNRYYSLHDDAMISMRYAWNFSHGQGLVWNPNERVEGYTNLLMVLLMSVLTGFLGKGSSILAVQIIAIVFLILIALLSISIYRKAIEHPNIPVAAVFLLSMAYYPLAFWTLNGMETGLLTLLLYLGIYFALKFTESNQFPDIVLTALFLGLAYLTRPDSLLFACWIIAFPLLFTLRKRNSRRTLFYGIITGSIYISFIFGQSVFRWFYYGELLPNTFVLKLTGMSLAERLRNGSGFITLYLEENLLILGLMAISLPKLSKKELFLLSFWPISILYQVWVGGDAWPYWRMMAPFMPIAIILFVSVAINFSRRFFRHKLAQYSAVLLLVGSGMIFANAQFIPEILFLRKPFHAYSKPDLVNTAIAINELTTMDASVGVFHAGTVPYFTDRRGIDFLGKCDKYVAHLPPDMSGAAAYVDVFSNPGHNKYDLDYSIKQLLPTYVEGFAWGRQDISKWAEEYYIQVLYRGVDLYLLKNSPEVKWSLLFP